jgi:predicted RNase H-like nuclease (RuvC/YqgF family)
MNEEIKQLKTRIKELEITNESLLKIKEELEFSIIHYNKTLKQIEDLIYSTSNRDLWIANVDNYTLLRNIVRNKIDYNKTIISKLKCDIKYLKYKLLNPNEEELIIEEDDLPF